MFKVPNPFDELVKKTTSEMLTAENWELIMEVCDRVGTDSERAHQCFEVINERILHRNANVVLYTVTLVQSMLENCGQSVQQEVASRAFTTTLTRVLNDKTVHEKVKSRVLGSIQQWAFDFRQDPTLSLMEETYTKLRAQRFHFPSPQKPEKIPKPSDIERQKEEDDLQLALALSLSSVGDHRKEGLQTPAAIRSEITRKQTVASGAGSGGVARRTTRVAGSTNAASGVIAQTAAAVDPKRKVQVKALFDFAATEAGELGFFKGDVIDVLDQKYRDWWKGELRGKHGIFPANFVQPLVDIRASVARDVDAEVLVFSEAHNIEALLRMLGSVDPMKSNVSDNEEIQRLYSSTWELRPKIIKLVEKYNAKKEELVALDAQLSKSMRLYDELMQRSVSQSANQAASQAANQAVSYGAQPQMQGFVGYSQPMAGSSSQQPIMAPMMAGSSQQPPMMGGALQPPMMGGASQQPPMMVSSQPMMAGSVMASPQQQNQRPPQGGMVPQQGYVQQPTSGAPQQMYYPQQQQQHQFAPQMYSPQQRPPPSQPQQPQQQLQQPQQQQQLNHHQQQQPQFQG